MMFSSSSLTQWLVFLIPSYLIRLSLLGIPTTLFEVILWIVFIYFVYTKHISFSLWKSDPLRWPLLLLLVSSVIAVVIAPDHRVALGQWKALILDPLMLYWLISSRMQTKDDWYEVASGLLLSGAVVALAAIGSAVFGHFTPDHRVIGIYGFDSEASPNYLALYLAPIAVLAFFWEWQEFSRRSVPLTGIILGSLMTTAIILSGSRGGLIALAAGVVAGLGWLIAHHFPARKKVIWGTLGALVIVGLILGKSIFLPNLGASEKLGGRLITSNNIRAEIWKTTATEIIPAHWLFGVGLGNYQNYFTELTKDRVNYPEFIAPLALHPHNFWLMTWVSLGILGVIAWLWIGVIVVRRWWTLSNFQIIFAFASVAWFIQGLVDTTYYKNDLAPLWFLIIAGLLMGSSSTRKSDSNK